MLNPREKRYLLITLVSAAALVVTVSVADPMIRRGRMEQQLKVAARRLQRYNNLLAKKKYYEEHYSGQLELLESGETIQDSVTRGLYLIDKLATSAGMAVLEMRPQTGDTEEAAIELKARGSMENLSRFLFEAERASLKLKRLQISPRPRSSELEVSFSLAVAGF